MLKILWVVVQIHSVDGFEFEKYTDHSFNTAGECANHTLMLSRNNDNEYLCAATYNGKKYVSQPSWMSNEQADMMVDKQNSLK